MEINPLYFVVKLLAYSIWMFRAGYVFHLSQHSRIFSSLKFGIVRLIMGFGFGIVIWLVGSLVYAGMSELNRSVDDILQSMVVYLLVYVPVRWIEWGIFELIFNPNSRTIKGFLLSYDPRSRWWRIGGIAISCLADIPVIIELGGTLPTGRFLC